MTQSEGKKEDAAFVHSMEVF